MLCTLRRARCVILAIFGELLIPATTSSAARVERQIAATLLLRSYAKIRLGANKIAATCYYAATCASAQLLFFAHQRSTESNNARLCEL